MNVIDNVFGVSPQALSIRGQRFELISANLANADTPGYKAVDIEFGAALAKAQGTGDLLKTNARHLDFGGSPEGISYRTPTQLSLDGNTVEADLEQSAFMDNAIRYQASLNFLTAKIKGLMLALRGD